MNNIKTTADDIYSYCVYAMDYDMMGLTFSASSFKNAIKNNKDVLKMYTEEDFLFFQGQLVQKVQSLYDKNRDIVDQGIEEGDVLAKISYRDAQDEMSEAETFLTYITEQFDYVSFKKVVV